MAATKAAAGRVGLRLALIYYATKRHRNIANRRALQPTNWLQRSKQNDHAYYTCKATGIVEAILMYAMPMALLLFTFAFYSALISTISLHRRRHLHCYDRQLT